MWALCNRDSRSRVQIATQAPDRLNFAAEAARTKDAWRGLLATELQRRALRQILRDGCREEHHANLGRQPLDLADANFRNGELGVAVWIRQQLQLHDPEGLRQFEDEYRREKQQLDEDNARLARENQAKAPPPEVAPKDMRNPL